MLKIQHRLERRPLDSFWIGDEISAGNTRPVGLIPWVPTLQRLYSLWTTWADLWEQSLESRSIYLSIG